MKKIAFLVVLLAMMVSWGALVPARAAESVTVTGEVIDTFCFALMGAKGESHRQCGLDCAEAGIPVGLLEERHKQGLRAPSHEGQEASSR